MSVFIMQILARTITSSLGEPSPTELAQRLPVWIIEMPYYRKEVCLQQWNAFSCIQYNS